MTSLVEPPFSDCKEIYLSDSTLDTRPDLTSYPNLAANPLVSMGNCYNKRTGKKRRITRRMKYDPYRTVRRAVQASRCAAADSGGFQVMMGKLPPNLNPLVTVEIYEECGFRATDRLLQLDLPPPYYAPLASQMWLIEQSVRNYHIMASRLSNIVAVVHGWTEEQLRHSYELLMNPEKVAVGANIAVGSRTKDRMRAAIGASLQSGQWVNDSINPSHKRQNGVVTPACMTEAHMTYLLDHVVSQGSPSRAAIGTCISASTEYALEHVTSRSLSGVAIGTNSAARGNYVYEHINSPGKRKPRQRVPMKVILERWALVARLLEEWDLLAEAGSLGQSVHYAPFGFYAGFKWGDSSAWRLKACIGEILLPYIPGRCIGGWRHIGLRKGTKGRKVSSEETKLIGELLHDSRNPLSIYGMPASYFLQLARYNMPEWQATRPKKLWPLKPFEARCLWNAYVLKEWEEPWVNSFENDPDRLARALEQRFSTPGFGRLRNEFRFFRKAIRQPYVQTDLNNFLKGNGNELHGPVPIKNDN